MPTPNLLPSSRPKNAVVNLLHLKLLHQFQTSTRETLLLSTNVWDHALQLSFTFDFLMEAILCITAHHLAFLQPDDPKYPIAASTHLSGALSGFRLELSNDLTSAHLDVFIATAVLLQFVVWTHTDVGTLADAGSAYDPLQDIIFTFSNSLKKVFLKSFPEAAMQPSVLLKDLQECPNEVLWEAAQVSETEVGMYYNLFSHRRPVTWQSLEAPLSCTRGMDADDLDASQHTSAILSTSTENHPAVKRLCLLMAFLPPRPAGTHSLDLLNKLARYILFPVPCHGSLVQMVRESAPHAVLWLFHFYRAARILLVLEKFWWAHRRAAVMEESLRAWLVERYVVEVEA